MTIILDKDAGSNYHSLYDDNDDNYYLECTITIPEDANCGSAVSAFVKALELDGYHPISIFKALIDCGYDVAEKCNHVDYFEKKLEEYLE